MGSPLSRPRHGYHAREWPEIGSKTTLPPFKLSWSLTINDIYWQKEFDALVSVSIEDGDWSCCHLEGWITKSGFFHSKQIADGVNCRLEPAPGL